jgi:hypothetical protein
MKRKLLIVLCALAAALLVACAAWYVYSVYQEKQPEQPTKPVDPYATNGEQTLELNVPPADPLIVGKWSNAKNPLWYKVYYDDYDGDGFFWGKEWDEKDDVLEYDLMFHGNGWFRWKKEGRQIMELHTMDARDVPIGKTYNIQLSIRDTLMIYEPSFRQVVYTFTRVND